MAKAGTAAVARKSLDAKFLDGSLGALAARPARGWIRAIRDALGMSSRQLATRMGQSQPAVSQLEHSEVDDRITLATLRRAADALECDLVYALVPRTTLDDTVRRRARSLARRDVASVDQTMRLEAQSLDPQLLDDRIEDYASRLLDGRRLWDDGVE